MTNPTGNNTEFYIVLQGVVTGPITGLEGLRNYNIAPDTPVWYEGLDDWKPAFMAPLTRQLFFADNTLFGSPAQPAAPAAEQPPVLPPAEPQPPAMPQPGPVQPEPVQTVCAEPAAVNAEPARKPASYLAWAIVATVLCNVVCGVVAIIYASKVNTKCRFGDFAGAERCSERAQWWIVGSICVGLIVTVARILTLGML